MPVSLLTKSGPLDVGLIWVKLQLDSGFYLER